MKIIFEKYAHRYSGKTQNWAITIPMIILVCVLFAIVSILIGDGSRTYMPGALVIVPLTMLFRRDKLADITFFVYKGEGDNFSYAVREPNGHQQARPLDEYSYWYACGPVNGKGSQFELYFEIKSKNETIYLKEIIASDHPPKDWPVSDVRVKTEKNTILINGLQELAYKIDQGTAQATAIKINS
jgi:hypothetical protein